MIRTDIDFTIDEKTAFEKQNGGYNEFPPGWREINKRTFAKSDFFTYSAKLIQYRQMLRYIDGTSSGVAAVSTHLYWMQDNTGYALVNDYWKGTIKYFAFGCKHQHDDPIEELKRRNIQLFDMQHAHFCKKCGWLGVYDSSD